MEEKSTLARPYAVAVFRLAEQDGKLTEWSEMLAVLASILADPDMQTLIASPSLEATQVAELVNEVGGERFTEQARELVRLLAQNGRLGVADEIAELYEAERARSEQRERIEVISAFAVNPKFKRVIAEAMRRRLGREVEIETRTDRSLIGGVVIRAGDLVIDASLKGRLAKLGATLA